MKSNKSFATVLKLSTSHRLNVTKGLNLDVHVLAYYIDNIRHDM